jgi:hypothetical protein
MSKTMTAFHGVKDASGGSTSLTINEKRRAKRDERGN